MNALHLYKLCSACFYAMCYSRFPYPDWLQPSLFSLFLSPCSSSLLTIPTSLFQSQPTRCIDCRIITGRSLAFWFRGKFTGWQRSSCSIWWIQLACPVTLWWPLLAFVSHFLCRLSVHLSGSQFLYFSPSTFWQNSWHRNDWANQSWLGSQVQPFAGSRYNHAAAVQRGARRCHTLRAYAPRS